MSGKVFLVGAGPGDPGLLTRRAAELIATADLVAIDALISDEIAALVPRGTEVVYVGKRAAAHALPQDQINALLVAEAKKGKRVVRLKGGDPFVFGRGGEEAEELAEAGVAFEVVPGISSAVAGPAYAGIPVTHRDHATSLTLVTGHESESTTGIRWPALAQLDGTIVFLMGFGNLSTIVRKLVEHGMPAGRPVAVISNATRPQQRSVTATLATIEAEVAAAALAMPALIVVGEVVRLHDAINWFERRPLFGRRVVVTRAREQASELKRLLEESGATVLQFPTIEIVAPESYDSVDRVVRDAGRYSWLIFSSTNGVRTFWDRLYAAGRDARALARCRVAAVGETTAADLRARGIVPDLVPEKFQSAALLPHFGADLRGERFAVVRAEEGSDELLEGLRARGAEADLAVAYRTVASEASADELRALIEGGRIDAVTFTSASTVEHFYGRLSGEERRRINEVAVIASIGPVTSEAVRRHGRAPDVEAPKASVQALHDALLERLTGTRERTSVAG